MATTERVATTRLTTQEDIVTRPGLRKVLAVSRIVIGFTFLWAFLDKLFGLNYTTAAENAWINGAGGLAIDRVKGLSFDLAVQGPGIVRIDNAEVDQLKVGISGAGSARLAGQAAKLTATVRGPSSFEAEGLSVKDAVIGAEGPSIVRAQVSNEARVDAMGLASVTLTGNPACTVNAKGSASVTGCK